MGSKSNTFENLELLHVFQNADIANVGDAAGLQNAATEGSLYVALCTSATVASDADYTLVQDNVINSTAYGINMAASSSLSNRIIGNDLDNCTDDIYDEGTTTLFGSNIWADGSYDNTP